jgi:hypothetical protein
MYKVQKFQSSNPKPVLKFTSTRDNIVRYFSCCFIQVLNSVFSTAWKEEKSEGAWESME